MSRRHSFIALTALRTILRSRFRSGLLISIAMLGVAGVLLSVDFAAGGREQVLMQIRRMGTNLLVVSPRLDRSVGGRARTGSIVTTLVEPDRAAIRMDVPRIVRTSPVATATLRLKAGDLSKETTVIGCEPDYFFIKGWSVAAGSLFDDREDRKAVRSAVVGKAVARDLFGGESPIRQRLTIGGVPFEIVGVLSERGQGLDTANEDDQVYVPLRTAMRRLMNRDFYSGLWLEVGSWEDMTGAAGEVRALLRRRHHRLASLPDDFDVASQKALAETRLAASERLGFLVRWIGWSALGVSGLGILAIGWIAVKARTAEIGTRRAIGATAVDIFLQILTETAVICSIGCIAGLAVGWQGSRLLAAWASVPYVFDAGNAKGTLLIAVLLNLCFALLPAAKASAVHPIRALGYE
ncbi:MAG TPA: ABC transporter permease [Thermoanaerobaculia bacterium]